MPRCANPLFLKWVKEFHAEKDYRKRGGPPRPTGYENAVRALQNCTEKYEHPIELKKLNGVGPTCISRLIEKLETYCANKHIPMPEPPAPKRRAKPKLTAAQKRAAAAAAKEAGSEDAEASTSAAPRKPRGATKRKKADDSDDDDEYVERPRKRRVTRRKVVEVVSDSD